VGVHDPPASMVAPPLGGGAEYNCKVMLTLLSPVGRSSLDGSATCMKYPFLRSSVLHDQHLGRGMGGRGKGAEAQGQRHEFEGRGSIHWMVAGGGQYSKNTLEKCRGCMTPLAPMVAPPC